MSRSWTCVGLVATVAVICLSGGVLSAEDNRLETVLKTFRSEFVEITPGQGVFPAEFTRGSMTGAANEQPLRKIRVTRSFQIARYEVWQELYEQVLGHNPSRWKGPRNSVEMMTWQEAVNFCDKATLLMRERKLIGENDRLRLPTESEWEYCCRAGTASDYSFGNDAQAPGDVPPKAQILDAYAWHTGNAAGNDPPVGALKPNPWGLYDMHGYLREFCLDVWQETQADIPAEAHLPVEGETASRGVRGGSWKDPFPRLRSSARESIDKAAKDDAVGFRCVLVSEPR